MTLCPIALVAGCIKCPAFSMCPLKSVIGDHREPDGPEDRDPPGGKPEAPEGKD